MDDAAMTGTETTPSARRGERAIERALERAAVRELQSTRREEYARQIAQEREVVERMRHERNAVEDERRAQAWQMAVERELAGAQRRGAWVDAHAATAEAKRAARLAEREASRAAREFEREQAARIRHEKIAYEDELSAARLREGGEKALAMSKRHTVWTDAIQTYSDAKKAAHKLAEDEREQRKADRAAARARAHEQRRARNERDDERGEMLRRAARDIAVATAQRWEAERLGEPEGIRRALEAEKAAREAHAQLKKQFLHDRAREEDETIALNWKAAKDAAVALAEKNEELNEARYRMALERRRATLEFREIRRRERAEEAQQAARLREERNAREKAWRDEVDAMNHDREFALCDLRQEWLDAKEAERRVWAQVRDEDKAAMAADLRREAEFAQAMRHQRNEEEDESRRAVWEMYKKREYDRSVEREAARANARVAYKGMDRVLPENEG